MARDRRALDAERPGRRQRAPVIVPIDQADNPVVRGYLERIAEQMDSEAGKRFVRTLRLAKRLPASDQAELVRIASSARTGAPRRRRRKLLMTTRGTWLVGPEMLYRRDLAGWVLGNALARGLVLPGLQKADVVCALGELLTHDENIAAVMSRSREQRTIAYDVRKADQQKMRMRRSRLNSRRKRLGYPVDEGGPKNSLR